jgi:hypothetical protein
MAGFLFAAAGATLDIGPAKAWQAADFALIDFTPSPPLTWTRISLVESYGALGDANADVAFSAVDLNRDYAAKGTANAGTMPVVVGIKDDDPGQIALAAAQKTKFNYAFKFTFPNKSQMSGAVGAIRYFIALVLGVPEELGAANNIAKMNVALKINSNIVRVAAT